jgi:hypothetical protein
MFARLDDFLRSTTNKPRSNWIKGRFQDLSRWWPDIAGQWNDSELTATERAAAVWLLQLRQFNHLISEFGTDRIRTLRSDRFLEHPGRYLNAIAAHCGLESGQLRIEEKLDSGFLFQHAKTSKMNPGPYQKRESDSDISLGLQFAERWNSQRESESIRAAELDT